MDPRALQDYSHFVRSVARALIADEHAAEDIAQLTLTFLIESPPKDTQTLRPWLRRVVQNLSRNEFRRRRRDRERLETCRSNVPPPLPTPSESVEIKAVVGQLGDAVLQLDEPYRSTIILRFYENLTSHEIAKQWGIPQATVRTRLYRALQALRQRLDHLHEDDRKAWRTILFPFLATENYVPPSCYRALPTNGFLSRRSSPIRSRRGLFLLPVCAALLTLLFLVPQGTQDPPTSNGSPTGARAEIGVIAKDVREWTPDEERIDPVHEVPSVTVTVDNGTTSPPRRSLELLVNWADRTAAEGVRVAILPWIDQETPPAPPGHKMNLVTGSDGQCTAEDLPEGSVEVFIDRLAYSETATVRPGSRSSHQVDLPEGSNVIGRIVDEAGRPVENADIYLVRGSRNQDSGVIVARSDPDGGFVVRDVYRRTSIGARAPGRTPTRLIGIPWGAGRIDVDLCFGEEGGSVSGLVRDPSGEPVPSASVLVWAPGRKPWELGKSITQLAPPMRRRTDDQGHFAFDGVWQGKVELYVQSPEFASQVRTIDVESGSAVELGVQLRPSATLVGSVCDSSGRVISNARVSVTENASPPFTPRHSTLSRFDGSFRIEGLSPGSLTARVVELPGAGSTEITFNVAPGEVRAWSAELTNEKSTFQGRVIGNRGESLVDWRVLAWAPPRLVDPQAPRVAHPVLRGLERTDSDGSFSIGDRIAAPHFLEVFGPSAEALIPSRTIRNILPSNHDVMIKIDEDRLPTATISGSVFVANRRRASGAKLVLTPIGVYPENRHLSIPLRGEFCFGPLVPGRYRLKLRMPHWHPRVVTTIVIGDYEVGPNDRIELDEVNFQGVGSLRARFEHEDGFTGIRTLTSVASRIDEFGIPCRFDGDDAVCSSLLPGPYYLMVIGKYAWPVGTQAVPFEIRPGEETFLPVILHNAVRATLWFTEFDGQRTTRSYEIAIWDPEGHCCYKARKNLGGGGRMAVTIYLRPGNYHITAVTDSGLEFEETILIEKGRNPAEPIMLKLH